MSVYLWVVESMVRTDARHRHKQDWSPIGFQSSRRALAIEEARKSRHWHPDLRFRVVKYVREEK